MIEEAIAVGPHICAMILEAMKVLAQEVQEKARKNQYRLVNWDDFNLDHLAVSPSGTVLLMLSY